MTNIDLDSLHTNQRLFVQELQQRGIKVELIDPEIELLKAIYNEHVEYILDRYCSISPFPITRMVSDKILAKRLMAEAGISVPKGRVFEADSLPDLLPYANELGFPLVVKPNWGSHGDQVFVDLGSEEQLLNAVHDLITEKGPMPFIVEQFFVGDEYRVFITTKGDYAVINRKPAHVIGDGIHTILELAEQESKRRMNPRNTVLSPIIIDSVAIDYLKQRNLDGEYIPQQGEKIFLRNTTNVSKGGTCEDYTELVHPSVIELAKQILKIFIGLPYAGVDILSKDITKPQTEDSYTVVEVNPNPGFALHMKPGSGMARNVASYLASMVFPETH